MPSDAEPKLTVEFKLDDAGHPTFVEGPDQRHYYNLILEVGNPPPDTYAATFELDPSASYDAVHTLRPEPNGGFRLEATAYGDSPVVVRLRRSNGEDLVLRDGIARGLRKTLGPLHLLDPISPFREALSYIGEH